GPVGLVPGKRTRGNELRRPNPPRDGWLGKIPPPLVEVTGPRRPQKHEPSPVAACRDPAAAAHGRAAGGTGLPARGHALRHGAAVRPALLPPPARLRTAGDLRKAALPDRPDCRGAEPEAPAPHLPGAGGGPPEPQCLSMGPGPGIRAC